MEKIEYYCDGKELGYTFPEWKWYEELYGKIASAVASEKCMVREKRIFLPAETENELPILLHILESGERRVSLRLYPVEKAGLYHRALLQSGQGLNRYERLILFDGRDTESFLLLLPKLAGNLNRLEVITRSPLVYQPLFDWLLEENGLAAYCMTEVSQRADAKRKGTLILYNDFNRKIPVHDLESGCHFWDLSFDGRYEREIRIKRPDITYFGLGKFLDTTVKLRYNTLVKDGIVNQYIVRGNNKKRHT